MDYISNQVDTTIDNEQQTLGGKIYDQMVIDIIPTVWLAKGHTMQDFLDVVMHLLFSGVVKATSVMVSLWLKQAQKKSSFVRRFGKLLETAAKKIGWHGSDCALTEKADLVPG